MLNSFKQIVVTLFQELLLELEKRYGELVKDNCRIKKENAKLQETLKHQENLNLQDNLMLLQENSLLKEDNLKLREKLNENYKLKEENLKLRENLKEYQRNLDSCEMTQEARKVMPQQGSILTLSNYRELVSRELSFRVLRS